MQKKKELGMFLEDDAEDDHPQFDILNWWKLKILFLVWLEIYWSSLNLLYHLVRVSLQHVNDLQNELVCI